MNVNQLLANYNCGPGATWTRHGQDGLLPNSAQYDLSGNADHHISVNHDATGEITGVHYTIRNEQNAIFHLYYYTNTNAFHIDFAGTRNPQTINIEQIRTRLATWCVVSQYDVNANSGAVGNLTTFQKKVAELEKANMPKMGKNKRGQTTFSLTGGGERR